MKISSLFIILVLLVGCTKDDNNQNTSSFAETSQELMEKENNPIPEYLYTIPSVRHNKK